MPEQHICGFCTKPMTEAELEEARHENTRFDGSLAHTDCYYESLGKLVEEHPIVSAGIHRG